jgi:hypothetical protein
MRAFRAKVAISKALLLTEVDSRSGTELVLSSRTV